jgi:hypothetical protein
MSFACPALSIGITQLVGMGTLLIPNSDLMGPRGWLISGLFLLFLAVGGTLTGGTLARYGQIVNRAEDPKEFWWTIAIYFLGGICFIGYFLYKVYGFSN